MNTDIEGLTIRERRFCEAYLAEQGRDASAAYVRAGYRARNAATAAAGASRLLTRVKVRIFLERRQREIAELTNVSMQRFTRELSRLTFSDVTRLVRAKGKRVTIRDTDLLSPDESAAISEISQTQNGIKIKLHSKSDALKTLGQVLGYIKPDGAFNGSINVNIGNAKQSDLKAEVAELLKDKSVRDELRAVIGKAERTGR